MKKLKYILLIFCAFNFSNLYSDDFHTTLKKKLIREMQYLKMI